ncbi:hypothetical protein [Blastococcus sp. SYSU DS0616]
MEDPDMANSSLIQWTPGPVVMLWDMDNVLTGRQDVPGLARLLGDFGSPEVRRVAAGHFVTCRAHGATARKRGFEVLNGGRRPQGADRQLLRHASRQAKRGARHFWVVSNDGGFSRVADAGYLTVLTLDETRVSTRLRAAALTVISLRRSAGEWRIQYRDGAPFTPAV